MILMAQMHARRSSCWYNLCSSQFRDCKGSGAGRWGCLTVQAKLPSRLRRTLPKQQEDRRIWSAQDAVLKYREAVRVLLTAQLPHNLVLLPATCTFYSNFALQHTPPTSVSAKHSMTAVLWEDAHIEGDSHLQWSCLLRCLGRQI